MYQTRKTYQCLAHLMTMMMMMMMMMTLIRSRDQGCAIVPDKKDEPVSDALATNKSTNA